MRWLRFLPGLLVTLFIVGTPFAYAQWRERDVRNFRVVQDRVLYRSGQLSPAGLQRIVHDYGIRTIVSFRYAEEDKGKPEPLDAWEETYCAKAGINYVRIRPDYWHDHNGTGIIPAEVGAAKFLRVVSDPQMQPVLVHCYRGVHRTGAHCALFRMECQGWSNADAIAEMKATGYDTLDKEDDIRTYMERYQRGVTIKLKP